MIPDNDCTIEHDWHSTGGMAKKRYWFCQSCGARWSEPRGADMTTMTTTDKERRPRCEKCGGFKQANRSCLNCFGQLVERVYGPR